MSATTRAGAEPIRGAPIAKAITAELRAALDGAETVPHLVNVVVGADDASGAYLSAIDRRAQKLGLRSSRRELPADASQADVEAAVDALAADDDVHALMIQFPLPDHLDARAIADRVPPRKDVDGVTRAGLGRVLAGERAHVAPATAAAVVEILASDERLDPAGRDVVVIGRSLVVGRPLAAMLVAPGRGGHATVTLCHTRTAELRAHTRRADVLVVAAGRRGLLTHDFVKPGAVVVDVGTHVVETDDGTTLAGDCAPEVAEVAGFLTPVPGGVGPVTNAILMRHVVAAACPGLLEAAW